MVKAKGYSYCIEVILFSVREFGQGLKRIRLLRLRFLCLGFRCLQWRYQLLWFVVKGTIASIGKDSLVNLVVLIPHHILVFILLSLSLKAVIQRLLIKHLVWVDIGLELPRAVGDDHWFVILLFELLIVVHI